MKTKLTLGCLLALAALLMVNAPAQPVAPCITNLYIATWGDLSLEAPYFSLATNSAPGHCTNANTYTFNSDGRILLSDCSGTNCIGIPITITANDCTIKACYGSDQVIGTIWWKCDSSPQGCDPQGGWHNYPIVLPHNRFWTRFYICSLPTCNIVTWCITESYECSGAPNPQ